jgi:hypothetical protein
VALYRFPFLKPKQPETNEFVSRYVPAYHSTSTMNPLSLRA